MKLLIWTTVLQKERFNQWEEGQRRRRILVHSEFEDEESSNDSNESGNDETDYDSDTDSDYDE